jgi:hypothetical protein
VAQNNTFRRSAIDGRTTRHAGYRISMTNRKRIEEPFGWMKTIGGLRKARHRGRALVDWFFVLTATAYNLVRIPRILAATDESVWRVGMMQKTSRTRRIRRAIRLVPLPTVSLKTKMCTEHRSFSATC